MKTNKECYEWDMRLTNEIFMRNATRFGSVCDGRERKKENEWTCLTETKYLIHNKTQLKTSAS